MVNLIKVAEFVAVMNNQNSRTYKKSTLKSFLNDPVIRSYVELIYNTYLTFGVTADGILNSNVEAVTPVSEDLYELLGLLAARKITGNTAIAMCKWFVEETVTDNVRAVLLNILDKDLKIGVDTKTINEVWNNCIPVFDVALAHDINKSPAHQVRVEQERYVILRKLDGVRCIVTHQQGQTVCRSRTGLAFTSLALIEKEVARLFGDTDVVLDGELCVIDSTGKENFKQAVSEIRRKDFVMDRPHYKVFDMLTVEEFLGKTQSAGYVQRLCKARSVIGTTPFISVVGATLYSEQNLTTAEYLRALHGWEGLILRADTPYRAGRTSDLLKVKPMQTAEFRIVGWTPTKKTMLVGGIMVQKECMGSITIELASGDTCDVGSGFTEQDRLTCYESPERFVGKLATIKYFEESTDKTGKPSLRFPIFISMRDTIE